MTEDLRSQFPILHETAHDHPLIWLDNAATTQKPRAVIQAISHFYEYANANVHRASHTLSARATHGFEDARETARKFLSARFSREIIWTRGATEALNLLAWSWGRSQLQAGDEIILSAMEHHANIVPWQQVAKETGAIIRVIPVNERGQLDFAAFEQLLNARTKLVSVCHVSNALGTINPVKKIIASAKSVGAVTIIDGAQAVAHFPVNVQELGCDFYVFSGHKVYGPTGIGVLYGRRELLETLPPWQTGGEMIERVSFSGTTFNQLPFRFEAGTPNIAGVIGMDAALKFLMSQNRTALLRKETRLRERLEQGLGQIPGLRLIGTASHKTAVVSFIIDDYHNQDLGVLLDQQGIAVRTGHHCAMPLMEAMELPGTVRVSLGCYNTREDVDALVTAMQQLVSQKTDEQPSSIHFGPERERPNTLPGPFADTPFYSELNLNQLRTDLLSTKNWQDRYRSIMQLAWDLPTLPDDMRGDDARLTGCESKVWLHHYYHEPDFTLHFTVDSDARVVRGLSVIVLTLLNGRTPQELLDCNINALFRELELSNHLSPSRSNGLRAIVEELESIAQRYL